VTISHKLAGGIKINASSSWRLSEPTIRALTEEFHLPNAEITINEKVSLEQLIDVILGNRVYLPALTVINKSDLTNQLDTISLDAILISAKNKNNLEKLKEKIWEKLNLMRVYAKGDLQRPFIVRQGSSLKKIIEKFIPAKIENYQKARIWGPGAKFPGQLVSLSFCPSDGTIVQFN
jgi:ribosome-interacting GTPase 1